VNSPIAAGPVYELAARIDRWRRTGGVLELRGRLSPDRCAGRCVDRDNPVYRRREQKILDAGSRRNLLQENRLPVGAGERLRVDQLEGGDVACAELRLRRIVAAMVLVEPELQHVRSVRREKADGRDREKTSPATRTIWHFRIPPPGGSQRMLQPNRQRPLR